MGSYLSGLKSAKAPTINVNEARQVAMAIMIRSLVFFAFSFS